MSTSSRLLLCIVPISVTEILWRLSNWWQLEYKCWAYLWHFNQSPKIMRSISTFSVIIVVVWLPFAQRLLVDDGGNKFACAKSHVLIFFKGKLTGAQNRILRIWPTAQRTDLESDSCTFKSVGKWCHSFPGCNYSCVWGGTLKEVRFGVMQVSDRSISEARWWQQRKSVRRRRTGIELKSRWTKTRRLTQVTTAERSYLDSKAQWRLNSSREVKRR
jgi:hypothetical protein